MLILKFFVKINSQAPARKSNPQAPVAPCAALSVKTCSESSEIKTTVFKGAENHLLTHKFEIYVRNSRKLINFMSIFWSGKYVYGACETMSVRSHHPRMTHWWRTHLFHTISYKSFTSKSTEIKLNHYFIVLKMTRSHSRKSCDSLTKFSISN